ncbi:hypothetical protein ACFWTC_04725 [Streptomyces sp. NPDC058619]|uniref:hypothetical protein n=1 Tax=unclassified Streptomyces TaxID=2593676 RepID=UPI003668B35F
MDPDTFRTLLSDEGQALLAVLADADPAGEVGAVASVELSSHLAVSEYELDRVLHEIGVVMIDALSLGRGADALVLSWSHDAVGVDGDPLTLAVAAANRRAMDEPVLSLARADIGEFDGRGEAVLVDPMRRAGPGGRHDPEAYDLPQPWALDRVRTTGAGWVRLAPDLPDEAVPDLGRADEAEWISYGGAARRTLARTRRRRRRRKADADAATLFVIGSADRPTVLVTPRPVAPAP